MFDLGTSFLASVSRDPRALALVDGVRRWTYAEWFRDISALTDALQRMGFKPGDHLVSLLQNRAEAATLHWACQFAGLIITPLNWRASTEDLNFCLTDAEAVCVVFEDVSATTVAAAQTAHLPRIKVGAPLPGCTDFASLISGGAPDAVPLVNAEAWSLMLYTSGTTSNPKGVPRRHRAERAAALAHVAQNIYRRGERTLGVMPLYHTMGVRSLLAMSLIGGAFICLPRFDVKGALAAIERERVTNLYLVPTLYHDLVHHAAFADTDISSVRKLGFAGAPMTDGLLQKLQAAFQPELFVNHYGSSEVYTFSIAENAVAKPGSAGRAGLNQMIRVIKLGQSDPHSLATTSEEGEVAVLMSGDEAFEGYWKRPESDAKSLRQGWYLTGDTGYLDPDGDLFVTGRVDDMIITGGENVSPVEVESCLSLHPAVGEVAVVGLPDARWGKLVTAFVQRRAEVSEAALDAHCRSSGLAPFKRPRAYVFVVEVPKSPVGKLLRRKLVAGEFMRETATL